MSPDLQKLQQKYKSIKMQKNETKKKHKSVEKNTAGV